ncbi:MAG: hypothetical protein IJO96_09385 [Oscillospiraceae bacterium]|nr:hypothetical protein [Oscillospiraceae bacterium]
MLYTVADVDIVLHGNETAAEHKGKRCEISVECGKIEGVIQNGEITVRRLISTDPVQYLNKKYAPGAVWKQNNS